MIRDIKKKGEASKLFVSTKYVYFRITFLINSPEMLSHLTMAAQIFEKNATEQLKRSIITRQDGPLSTIYRYIYYNPDLRYEKNYEFHKMKQNK